MIWDLLFGIPNGPADGLQALPEDDTTDPGHKNHGCDLLLDCWPQNSDWGALAETSAAPRRAGSGTSPWSRSTLAFWLLLWPKTEGSRLNQTWLSEQARVKCRKRDGPYS